MKDRRSGVMAWDDDIELKLVLLGRVEQCALTSSGLAASCLDVAELASDRTLHDALIIRAEQALHRIDRLMGAFDFDDRQLAEIYVQRHRLAARVSLSKATSRRRA